jgi:uncharacterized metal-binding protein YceD (DUF177 family)
MSTPEFSRMVDIHRLPSGPLKLTATPAECAALARRFALVSLARLDAEVVFTSEGDKIDATGQMSAAWIQSCAVSGEDLPVTRDEPLTLRFVPERPIDAEELELAEGELDEIPYAGEAFDIGEAIAQTLGLTIDPYAVGPEADRVRRKVGLLDEQSAGPFAALAALKKDLG